MRWVLPTLMFALAFCGVGPWLAPASADETRKCGDPPPAEALFGDDDLLLLSAASGGVELTDAFPVYSSRAGAYVPLGNLARLLGLAILSDPPQQRATGWIISQDRRFELDLKCRRAEVGDQAFDFEREDAAFFQNDIFVRSTLITRLLPISLKINKSELTMEITSRERLPFEERIAREKKRTRLGTSGGPSEEIVLKTPHDYSLFTPPSIDLGLRAQAFNRSPHMTESWEVRLGGDFGYSNLQVFAGSDEDFNPSSMRVLLERKDPDGERAAFFGATRAQAGDVYAPSLPLGASSISGRGVFMTSQPLDQASVFSTIDIRGELPLGYEVELYVNEVLRGSQAVPVRGNYEFLNVPLTYGLNIIRLVFYGPRGERREEIRRINVGSAQLEAGKAVFNFGALQQDTPLVELRDEQVGQFRQPGKGSERFVGSLAYGVANELTLSAGFAYFTPAAAFLQAGEPRSLAVLGALTSLAGVSFEANVSADSEEGMAAAIGFGGRVYDVSFLGRHAEYSGGFIDETQIRDLSVGLLRRASTLTADSAIDLPFVGIEMPMIVHGQRSEFVDGGQRWLADAHVSTVIGPVIVSNGVQYQADNFVDGAWNDTATGSIDASTLVWRGWRGRLSATYEARPTLRIKTAEINVDGPISDWMTLRLGVSHAFPRDFEGAPPDDFDDGQSTTFLSSLTWQSPISDISAFANYTPERNDFGVGLQVALSAIFDPQEDTYHLVRPGGAAGGTLIVNAFVDQNGNGLMDPGEAPMPGVRAQAGNWPATSNAQGRLIASGLGDGALARVQIDPESIDDPFLSAPADVIALVPDPGKVVVVNYPLRALGEIGLKLVTKTQDGREQGVSAVDVQLVSGEGAMVAEGHTEYDGTLILERIPAGDYTVKIADQQAQDLRMKLAAPMTITMPHGGGFVSGFKGEIVFE